MKKIMNLIDQDNKSDKCEILCSFDSDMTGKGYVVYNAYSEEGEKELILNAGSYDVIDEDTLKINTNITHEENEMITTVVKNILEQAEKLSNEE